MTIESCSDLRALIDVGAGATVIAGPAFGGQLVTATIATSEDAVTPNSGFGAITAITAETITVATDVPRAAHDGRRTANRF